MKYNILLQSLRANYRAHNTKWVRLVEADSIIEATAKAIAANPNLGITPTTVSMAWRVLEVK
jgi:hypothetical protein